MRRKEASWRGSGSDEKLVRELAAGDQEALGVLFERHRDFVFRVALGLIGEREDAVDVVQEVFLALLRKAADFDFRRAQLSTWLYRVARNHSLDRRASASRVVEFPVSDDYSEGSQERIVLEAERSAALARAVASLPSRAREVFVLRIGLGRSVEESAHLIGCSKGAVRVALHAAGQRLRELLAPGQDVSSAPPEDSGEEAMSREH